MPLAQYLEPNTDMVGKKNAVNISSFQPSNPPMMLPYLRNPRICCDETSTIRRSFTTSKRRAVTRIGASRIPLLLYMERGVESDTDTALAPPLIPHPELLWRSLIQTTTIMKLSRPFPPSNIQQWEGSGTGVRLRINLGSERSVCCCRHNFF